jgi:predicted transcriptional regulator
MADNFNMKQFLYENKLGSYARNTVKEETKLTEATKYQPGDMWSSDFDYKGMLKAAANLSVSSPEELMQAISDSFEDVNYHRENSHLQDAIEAKKENDNDAIKFHLNLFKDELKKTIKNLKETQIFEREKIEEGEAAYEYEKGKEAGEEEEKLKEDIGGDIGDAEAEKMMDFLAEKDKVKETLSGEAYIRMDGLADQNALADFRDSAYYVISALREDGFDDEDILEYLTDNLNVAFD